MNFYILMNTTTYQKGSQKCAPEYETFFKTFNLDNMLITILFHCKDLSRGFYIRLING